MEVELPKDFKDFLRLLNDEKVDYLLIGGYAVGYYGYPRATNDIDIWIAIHPENAQKVVNVLKKFGFNAPELGPELFLQQDKIIRMGHPPMRIKILTSISGVEFDECLQRKKVDTLAGISVNLISLKDLKRNKKASGRHKDLDDLENLP
jgi:predicted nucleotidyltransferase